MALAAVQEYPEQAPQEQPPQEGPEAPKQPFTFQDKPIDEHPELVNLAKYLDPNDLLKLGQQCYEEYKEDLDSRAEWEKMQAEWIKLYYGKMKPIDPPWEGASDDHLPILAEGCVQFHARSYKAFFASRAFVSGTATGTIKDEDKQRADRVGKYMSWQLGVKDKSYKRRKDRLLKALPLHGSYFTKTYRDNLNRRIMVENVGPIDLVANYACTGTDVEELERKTHRIYLAPRLGRYYGSDATKRYFLHPPEEAVIEKSEFHETVEEISGVKAPQAYVGGKPSLILEQHRYLDLDGDGIEEPYIVWIDSASQKVLRIAIRWAWADWQETGAKDPLEFFTHYVYIENPDGFYGFGQGHLTGDLNIACDKMLRQIVNAGTLQNSRPGFATQQAGLKSGSIKIQPGKIEKLNSSAPIRDTITWQDHPGPSEGLWRVMGLLTQRADRLNMVTDMLTGQPDKVYQTGTASMLVEQGLMTFSAVQIRVHAALEQELAKVFRLNGLYLNEKEYVAFNDGQSTEEVTVWRTDFSDDIQVSPAFDPHQLSEQERKQQVQIEYQAGMANPMIMKSPTHFGNLTRRFFVGIGSTNVNEIIPDPKQIIEQSKQMSDMKMKIEGQQQGREDAKLQAEIAAKAEDRKLGERKLDVEEAKVVLEAVKAKADMDNDAAQLKADFAERAKGE